MIYHITQRQAWERAARTGSYQADSLATEGFIHCSRREQLLSTANRYFRGHDGLVVLCIDPDLVAAEIRCEALSGSEEFPHIYGPLDLAAVRQVLAMEYGADGHFKLPAMSQPKT